MVAHEQRVYDYMLKNLKLQKCGPWICFSRRVQFSDGSALPFSFLPDDLMRALRMIPGKMPHERVYTVIP